MAEILLQVLSQFKPVRTTRNLSQFLATVTEILVHTDHEICKFQDQECLR